MNVQQRFYIVLSLCTLIFLILVFRAFELTYYSPLPTNAIKGAKQLPHRGKIFDRVGTELAVSKKTFAIAARPAQIRKTKQTAITLSKLLNEDASVIQDAISNNDKRFLYLRRNASDKIAGEIKRLNLPGVIVDPEPDRYYPQQQVAAGVIGFTGLDNEGLAGIEYFYNPELSGVEYEDNIGSDIYLTLSVYLQEALERKLGEAFIESKSKAAAAVLLEASTGNVLAMASFPTFDPNNAQDFSPKNHRNRSVSDVFEPGSTFKVFILASLLNERAIPPAKKFDCPGYYQGKSGRVSCTRKHGRQNLAEVIKNSCNTGIIEASKLIEPQVLYRYLNALGFGKTPAISLPAPAAGSLRGFQQWDNWLKMTIPIGHGLSASALQMARAGLAIARDGMMPEVSIIQRYKGSNQAERLISKSKELKIFEPDTTRVTRRLLAEVVSPSGTGRLAAIDSDLYQACGKTGTAVKYMKSGYAEDIYQPSFLGLFPCNKPRIVLYIVFDEPQGSKNQGGQLVAPVFKEYIEETMNHIMNNQFLQVKPMQQLAYDKEATAGNIMPNFMGQAKKEVSRIIFRQYPGEHKFSGAGYVMRQSPKPGTKLKPPYQFNFVFGFPQK